MNRHNPRTIENLADLFDREEPANLWCLAIQAHPTKPAAKEDGKNDILNIAGPQAVVFIVWRGWSNSSKLANTLNLLLDRFPGGFKNRFNCDTSELPRDLSLETHDVQLELNVLLRELTARFCLVFPTFV